VELPVWGYFLVTFLTIETMFLGVTLYLHRDQSHGGLILHPALRHVFRFWLWVSSGVVTREWVAVHRCHHAHADLPGDPHSPVVFGLRRVLFEGAELYRESARDPQLLQRYGRGTPEDWLERHLYSARPYAGITLFVLAHLLLFGIPGIIMIAVHLAAQPFFAGGVINGLGFAVQRWEIDIGWLWIRLFRALGLARVRWVAPQPHLERRRRELDAETVSALFTNRMHVLRDYGRRVVMPVCRELAEREGQGALPSSAPTLLIRHPAVLAEEARRKLRELLEKYEVLRRVVEYRDSLQQLWNENPARALAQLREWCHRAEESGIGALRDFAQGLPAYARG